MEAMHWGDFLFGTVFGVLFMYYILKMLILPKVVDDFIIDGVGKTYTERCRGRLYDIKISKHVRGKK